MSKLPAPSVSMPCESRILQSFTKEQVKLVLWKTIGRSHFIKEMPDYPVAAGITGTFHQEYILTYHCA